MGDDTMMPKDPIEVERDNLWERARRFELMARNMAKLPVVNETTILDAFRADGRCECNMCGLQYLDHPEVFAPTFALLCDGKVAKL